MGLAETGAQAAQEVADALALALPDQAEAMAVRILAARRIALRGVGREGLMMQALGMRLFHMGFDVHMVGDMTTPPVGPGDLLIVSAGPGALSTIEALLGVANGAGAETMCITATPDGPAPLLATHVVHLPAQTMASDQAGAGSILPMGSLFEGVMFLFFEVLILHLRDVNAVSSEAMRARHTNLE